MSRPPIIPMAFGKRTIAAPKVSAPLILSKGRVIQDHRVPYSDWIEQEIVISLELEGDKYATQKIQARVKSLFGVHKHVPTQSYKKDEDANFALSHIPTGLRTVAVYEIEDAFKIGEKLLELCKKALYETTYKGIQAALPDSIKRWGTACNKARKYLDPEPYLES